MQQQARHVRVAIVGSGFGGLGMAIRLKQTGRDDFLVFERAADVGGVWRENTYPGCACDVESHLYSLSFAPNPRWSRTYSPQSEILAYLKSCAERFGITPHLRLSHAIESAAWDGELARWRLQTSRGEYTADFVVAGVGGLSEPKVPELPGLESFEGEQFHSARWNHDYALAGKRVAVVGTGASAIQFVPAIQKDVSSLVLFQRTPPWILPRGDRAFSERAKRILGAVPVAQLALRAAIYARNESHALVFLDARLARIAQRLSQKYLERQIADPVLRAKLTPSYAMGCKRILISDEYLPALTQPNVTVETAGVERVEPHAIVARDGTRYEVDAIIFGTGFHVQDFKFAHRVRGRDGRTLSETWGETITAYLGTTIVNFPNLFMLQGPNTGLGHNSVVTMMESQFEHVLGALRHADEHALATLEPTREAQDAWTAEIERRTRGTVWSAGGCDSWYLDKNGRNFTVWPGFTFTYKRRVERFDPEAYETTPRKDAPLVLRPAQRLQVALGRALAALPERALRRLAGSPIVVDGQTLAPDMQLVLRAMGSSSALVGGSPGAVRMRQRIGAAIASGERAEVGDIREITVEDLRARHYAPPRDPANEPAPLVVFFHGGGFVFGDLDTHDGLCRMLCRHAGVHVLAIEYRLAPEHPFPAGIEDAERAWQWAVRNASALGADPSRIAIAGDSAGGNLATVVAQRTARTPAAPACQLLIYPTVDHHGAYASKALFADGFYLTREAMAWFYEQYVETAGAEPEDVRLKPLAAADLAEQPPALVVTAGFDPLRDEAEAYAAALRRHGSTAVVRRFGSLIHGFANMTGVSRSAHDAVMEIAGMLRTLLAIPAPRPVAARKPAKSQRRAAVSPAH